jgi:hypothetical protein
MSERFPTAVLEPIQRQLRRVRWRHNGSELQRAVFVVGAGAAGVGAALIGLALRAPPVPFVVGGGVLLLAWLALGAATVWRVRRRWVRARRTAAWVDRRAGLRGRLVTLLELARQQPVAPHAFGPLLVERNARGLAEWTPARVVPTAVPRTALAALLAAVAALVAVLLLAPQLRPPSPRLVYLRGAGDDWPRGVDGLDGSSAQLVVAPAPGADPTAAEREAERATGDAPEAASIVVEARSLQQRIRDGVWGKGWDDGDAAAGGGERAASDRKRDARRRAGDGSTGGAAGPDDAAAAPRAAGSRTATRAGGAGDGASGAGTHTDPNLYGIPAILPHTSEAAFQLALAARVRAEHAEPRPPEGPAPPAGPDLRPALAGRQRNEAAVHRMPVPSRYEPLVRALFAHRADERP